MPSNENPSDIFSATCSFNVGGEMVLIPQCTVPSSVSVARPLTVWEYFHPLEIHHSARSQISCNVPIVPVVSIPAANLLFLVPASILVLHLPALGNLTSSRKNIFAKYGPLHPSPRVKFPRDGIM